MAEELHRPTIDKSAWGEGPWTAEPDRAEWEHAGFPCLAVRGPDFSGHWCGYVAVPPGHPLHGKRYDDESVNVDVHGGLTYAQACAGDICHVPKPGAPDDVWWFGFDCAHAGDLSPAMRAKYLHHGYPFNSEPYDHVKAMAATDWSVDVYRTLDYVQAEANRLADQLAAVTARPADTGDLGADDIEDDDDDFDEDDTGEDSPAGDSDDADDPDDEVGDGV